MKSKFVVFLTVFAICLNGYSQDRKLLIEEFRWNGKDLKNKVTKVYYVKMFSDSSSKFYEAFINSGFNMPLSVDDSFMAVIVFGKGKICIKMETLLDGHPQGNVELNLHVIEKGYVDKKCKNILKKRGERRRMFYLCKSQENFMEITFENGIVAKTIISNMSNFMKTNNEYYNIVMRKGVRIE